MVSEGTVSTTIRDVEEVAQAFSNAGIELRFDRLRDRQRFSVEFESYPLGASQLVRTKWATDAWLTAVLPSRVGVMINPFRSAPSVFTISGDRVAASTGTAPVIQAERQVRVFRPADAPLLVLSADLTDLQRLFREISKAEAAPLEFESALNLETPEGGRLRRLVRFALEELSANPSALDSPIVRRQLNDLVLGGMLSFPGQHHRLLDRSNRSVGLGVVRRAEEFMEAHVNQPIGVSDVTAACGCSRTKLFLAFKQERAWTPLQFLVRQRMERARRALLSPGLATTVTKISLDCGYANVSRFARVYRQLFGEAPSATLKHSLDRDSFSGGMRGRNKRFQQRATLKRRGAEDPPTH